MSLVDTARDIDSMSREQVEKVAAALLREIARREPLPLSMKLTHLAIRLDGFAKTEGKP